MFGACYELLHSGSVVDAKQLPYGLRRVLPRKYNTYWSVTECRVLQIRKECKQVFLIDYMHVEDIPVFIIIGKILIVANEQRISTCGKIHHSVAYDVRNHTIK